MDIFSLGKRMTYGDYPDLSKVKKILVIKLRQIGDTLLTGAVFTALKHHLPQAELHAYVYSEAFDMLEGHPGVDHLIGYDRKWKKSTFFQRIRKEVGLWLKLRRQRYDLVINLTEGDRGALAAYIAGAKIRVGFQPKGDWQKKLYTHIVKHCPSLRHTVERNLDALRRIGIFPQEEEKDLFLAVQDEARRWVKERIKEEFILIHPTSRWRFKCWPMDRMRCLTEELILKGEKVVFTSGPDKVEQEMIAKIVQDLDVLNLSGQTSLKQLTALIDESKFLICVDSVSFHMANALKKPVVAIFGPTSDITWGPWRNPNAKIVAQNLSCRPCYQDGCGGSKRSDCLATLPVEKVLKTIDLLQSEIFSEIRFSSLRIVDESLRRT